MSRWPIYDRASRRSPVLACQCRRDLPRSDQPVERVRGLQATVPGLGRRVRRVPSVGPRPLRQGGRHNNLRPSAVTPHQHVADAAVRRAVPGMTPRPWTCSTSATCRASVLRAKRDDENPSSPRRRAVAANEVLGATDLAAYDDDRRTVDEIRRTGGLLGVIAVDWWGASPPRRRVRRCCGCMVRTSNQTPGGAFKSLRPISPAEYRSARRGHRRRGPTGPSTGMWELSRLAREGKVAELFDSVPMAELHERLRRRDPGSRRSPPSWTPSVSGTSAASPVEDRAKTWGIDPTPSYPPWTACAASPTSPRGEERRARRAAGGGHEAGAQALAATPRRSRSSGGAARRRCVRRAGSATAACAKLIHELRLPRWAGQAPPRRGRPALTAADLHAVRQFAEVPGEAGDFTGCWRSGSGSTRTCSTASRRSSCPGPTRWNLAAAFGKTSTGSRPANHQGVPGCGGVAADARVITSPDDPTALGRARSSSRRSPPVVDRCSFRRGGRRRRGRAVLARRS